VKEGKLKELFRGLLVTCPLTQSNPPECPLHEIRKMSLSDRYELANLISDEVALKLIDCHKKCMEGKIGYLPSWWQEEGD